MLQARLALTPRPAAAFSGGSPANKTLVVRKPASSVAVPGDNTRAGSLSPGQGAACIVVAADRGLVEYASGDESEE